MTSFDCIRELKRAWKRKDLGHGGTLDKFATGLLPVLVGNGLKLVRFFLENHPDLSTWWKTYTGTIALGRSTATGDPEGETLETRAVPALSGARIQSAMQSFVGVEYPQTPPVYSAKKIEGSRASDLARSGITPELKPVSVVIREFALHEFGLHGSDSAFIRFSATCSKGAYIRVLAQDLALKLGTVGLLTALERTAVGNFGLESAVTLDDACGKNGSGRALGLAQAVSFLPRFELLPVEAESLRTGRIADVLARLSNSGSAPGSYCAWFDGNPRALLELTEEKHGNFLRGL